MPADSSVEPVLNPFSSFSKLREWAVLMTSFIKPCMTRICHLPRARRGRLADSSLRIGMTEPSLKKGAENSE